MKKIVFLCVLLGVFIIIAGSAWFFFKTSKIEAQIVTPRQNEVLIIGQPYTVRWQIHPSKSIPFMTLKVRSKTSNFSGYIHFPKGSDTSYVWNGDFDLIDTPRGFLNPDEYELILSGYDQPFCTGNCPYTVPFEHSVKKLFESPPISIQLKKN